MFDSSCYSDRTYGRSTLSHVRLIDVTPTPVLGGLVRGDDGVSGLVKVFGGVLVLGRVAASDVAAGQAHAKVDPAIAGFQALLPTRGARRHIANLGEMGAVCQVGLRS